MDEYILSYNKAIGYIHIIFGDVWYGREYHLLHHINW
jgi:hypothetical protein